MRGPCLCGDLQCPSCGPAQGNWRCELCRTWQDDGCEHYSDGNRVTVYLPAFYAYERRERETEDAFARELERERRTLKDPHKPLNWRPKQMTCGMCYEDMKPEEECRCPGTNDCSCEYLYHHAGCCGSMTHLPADPGLNWKHRERNL